MCRTLEKMFKNLVISINNSTFASVFQRLTQNNGCRDGGMVDTRDLKSLDPEGLCGFESRSRHIFPPVTDDKQ